MTTPRRAPAPTPGARGARNGTLDAPGRSGVLKVASDTTPTAVRGSEGRKWCLWFPARLGPWRKGTKTVNGVKIPTRRRTHELPPGPNGSRGNPFAHAKWVKDWRDHAKSVASESVPSLERVRISAIVKRRALGKADEDNDRSRLKPLVDGLRDAGVIANDTRGVVSWGAVTEGRAGADGPGILLILEHIAPADDRPSRGE